jgi:predicted O-methyltransferase YrrM
MTLTGQDVKSKNQLATLDAWLKTISADLTMEAGSLFRIAFQHLPNWGVQVTDANREWIKRRSGRSYFNEWESGDEKTNQAIETATKSVVPFGNQDLNRFVAAAAAGIMASMLEQGIEFSRRRPFRICDVGTGTGDTVIALLDRLNSDRRMQKLASCCTFDLLDTSTQRLEEAERSLRRHVLAPRSDCYTLVRSDLCRHMSRLKESEFDMVLSNAVFHHMSFPDYLTHISNSLAEGGVMITGDWFTTLFESPAYAVSVLHELGAKPDKVELFESVFGIDGDKKAEWDARLTFEQRKANEKVLKYIGALAKETKGFEKGSRLYFLEAFESLGDRLEKMEGAGLVTDLDELRANYSGFLKLDRSVRRVFPGMDLACVIAAAKRKPGQTRPAQAGHA